MRSRPHPGRAPWKSPAALRVVEEVLAEPVVNGVNWTLPRLQRVIKERIGVGISKSRLSVGCEKRGLPAPAPAAHVARPLRPPGG